MNKVFCRSWMDPFALKYIQLYSFIIIIKVGTEYFINKELNKKKTIDYYKINSDQSFESTYLVLIISILC